MLYTIASEFVIMFYCWWKTSKICYESIDKIDFCVFEEEPTHELDNEEIDSVLYHKNAIPIVDDSFGNNPD